MQGKTDPPRDGFTTQQVEDALAFAAGGRVRWGVEWDTGTETLKAVNYLEFTVSDFDAGTHNGTEAYEGGLSVFRP